MPRHHSLAQFELMVVAAVARLGNDAFAVNVRREIEERSGRPAAMGAVYAALGRLEDKRLLRHRLEDPGRFPGSKARKRFLVTAAGRRELVEAATILTRMLDGLVPAEGGGS